MSSKHKKTLKLTMHYLNCKGIGQQKWFIYLYKYNSSVILNKNLMCKCIKCRCGYKLFIIVGISLHEENTNYNDYTYINE